MATKRPLSKDSQGSTRPLKIQKTDSTGLVISESIDEKKLLTVSQRNQAYMNRLEPLRIDMGIVHDRKLHIMQGEKECVVVSYFSHYTQSLQSICNVATFCDDGYTINADDFCIDYVLFCFTVFYPSCAIKPYIFPSDFMSLVAFMEKNKMTDQDVNGAINKIFPAIIDETKHFDSCFIELINEYLPRGTKRFVQAAMCALFNGKYVLSPLDEGSHFAKIIHRIAMRRAITIKIDATIPYNAIVQALREVGVTMDTVDDAYASVFSSARRER